MTATAEAHRKTWIDDQPPAMQAVLRQRAHIANLLPIPWVITRSYGTFTIPACPQGEEFSLTVVESRNAVMDLGDKRILDQPMLAAEIAEDLARHCNADAGDGSFLGVFMCGPQGPREDDLRDRGAQVDQFCERLVAAADRDYDRSKSTLFISDLQRYAAKRLHLEREWGGSIRNMKTCEGCGTNILASVAVCKTCGAILDRDKAERLGLVEPQTERNQRANRVPGPPDPPKNPKDKPVA